MELRLLFVGDVMLGRLVNEVLKSVPTDYPWGDTQVIFDQVDWRTCNLECVISDRGTAWSLTPKAFHFRSDAKNVAVLKAARIDVVSLANNHTLDFEYEAMFEMLRILDRVGIAHAGAGVNFAEASKPAFSNVKGTKIGLISVTDNEPAWEAKQAQPGIFYLPIDIRDERAQRLFEIVRRTKDEVDQLVVSIHWGPNWGYKPPVEQIPFAHRLIDDGADIVFGHSGHVFRGIELYQQRPIIYCGGNFIDDYAVDEEERNDESFIFVVELSGGRCRKLLLYPTIIADFQARLATGESAEKIASKMRRLCGKWNTKADWHAVDRRLEISIV